MITSKIKKDNLNEFYQSKFEYFKKVSGFSAVLIGLLEISYFFTDCQLFGRFAFETVIPRFSIILPLILFLYFNKRGISYKKAVPLYYILPHAAMWCTIWAIWFLPNRDFAREGFIIMHFAFLAVGLAMPLKYHIPIHSCLLVNIIVSNIWNHYEAFPLMISLALPLVIGVSLMLYILENSYADQYLITKQLEISSISDELTGTFNRYKLDELIDKETEHFTFDKDSFVLMLDIDFFKSVNDTYGHDAGDKILKFVSSEIKNIVYGRDYVIRWGGEEFVVILIDYTMDSALSLAETIREDIANKENSVCPITISIGLCPYDKNKSYRDAFCKADQALYAAKKQGRNRVICYTNL